MLVKAGPCIARHPTGTKCLPPSQVIVTTQYMPFQSQRPRVVGVGMAQVESNGVYGWGIWGGKDQVETGFRKAEFKKYL